MPEKFEAENFEPEDKEVDQRVQLKIVEPHLDKHFMIGFECKTENECSAYNDAIRRVLEGVSLDPFHQIGASPDGPNKPGYHAWEVWKKVERKDLEALLPEIEEEAQRLLELFEE